MGKPLYKSIAMYLVDWKTCPGEHYIEVDSSTTWQAPVAFKAKLKEKLQDLQNREIIAKVNEPTAWISQ